MNKRLLGYWIGTGAMLLGALVSVAMVAHSHASNLSLILVSIMVGAAASQFVRAWWHQWPLGPAKFSRGLFVVSESSLRLSVMWSLAAIVMAYGVRM